MLTSKPQDIFEFNMQYKNSIAFTEMKEIMTHLLYTITFNLDIFTKFIEKQRIKSEDSDNIINNAGDFFNISQTSEIIDLYSDNEFYELCSTFHKSISESKKIGIVARKMEDPVRAFIYFTKYMYIPVRVDVSTIPDKVLLSTAKRWLSILSILVQSTGYTGKYINIFKGLEVYHTCFKQILTNPSIRSKFKSQNIEKINSYLANSFDINHKISLFYITLTKLIYSINTEVIHKYCPNYLFVKSINPKYNGVWISPLDPDVNNQYSHIQACISLLD